MNQTIDPDLDLALSRIIKAPRKIIWNAWTTPAIFERWWVPSPALCKVIDMDPVPGGAFVTRISENGGDFTPHIDGCFLDIAPRERLVFTTALTGGWRPAENPFITAIITLTDHPDGTHYHAHVMRKSNADRNMHRELGFSEGWGSVIEQLAKLVE